jgi:uncharacterized membrane protein
MTNTVGHTLTDAQTIQAVRWRYRICNYLFKLGSLWVVAGFAGTTLAGYKQDESWTFYSAVAEIVGAGIFSAAFAMTLAIYRCPVCDKYLSRFRPSKEVCPSCGAKVWESKKPAA